jgi:hypothetical protein
MIFAMTRALVEIVFEGKSIKQHIFAIAVSNAASMIIYLNPNTRIVKKRRNALELGIEDLETQPALASFGRKRKFDEPCIEAAKILVTKYSEGYNDGTKFINGQGALPIFQKSVLKAGQHSIESVIHEVRESQASSLGKPKQSVRNLGSTSIYDLANKIVPEKTAKPTQRNKARIDALSDIFASISMAAILGGVHATFGLCGTRVSRFLPRFV